MLLLYLGSQQIKTDQANKTIPYHGLLQRFASFYDISGNL